MGQFSTTRRVGPGSACETPPARPPWGCWRGGLHPARSPPRSRSWPTLAGGPARRPRPAGDPSGQGGDRAPPRPGGTSLLELGPRANPPVAHLVRPAAPARGTGRSSPRCARPDAAEPSSLGPGRATGSPPAAPTTTPGPRPVLAKAPRRRSSATSRSPGPPHGPAPSPPGRARATPQAHLSVRCSLAGSPRRPLLARLESRSSPPVASVPRARTSFHQQSSTSRASARCRAGRRRRRCPARRRAGAV